MATQHRELWKSMPIVLTAAIICSCATHRAQAPQNSSTMESEDVSDTSHVHHEIDYIEFSVLDMAEAKHFYGAAFDWTFNDYGADYAGIRKGDGEAGGLRLASTVTTGGPLVVLYSENLDMTQAGGRITTEPFDFPGGRRFHFQDPSGNELAVYSEK